MQKCIKTKNSYLKKATKKKILRHHGLEVLLLLYFILICASSSSASTVETQPLKTIDFAHFWVTKSESKALKTILDEFRLNNGIIYEERLKDDAALRTLLSERIISGFTPHVFQWHGGVELHYFHKLGLLNNMNKVAKEFRLKESIPSLIYENICYNGEVIGIPTGVHSDNWIWYNNKIFNTMGFTTPKTWNEFLNQCKKLKKNGIIPIAVGNQMWELNTIFRTILLSKLGKEEFEFFYSQGDLQSISLDNLLETFEIFGQLKNFIQISPKVDSWAKATNLLRQGKAVFQFMGDWVEGEFNQYGMVYGKDYSSFLAPESNNTYSLVIDLFAFAKTDDPDIIKAQEKFARAVLTPKVQVEFNRIKGSIPANKQIIMNNRQSFPNKAKTDMMTKKGTYLINPTSTPYGTLLSTIDGVVEAYWKSPSMTAAQAVALITEDLKEIRQLPKTLY